MDREGKPASSIFGLASLIHQAKKAYRKLLSVYQLQYSGSGSVIIRTDPDPSIDKQKTLEKP